MGKNFATCGHEIPDLRDDFRIILKDSTIDYDLDRIVNAVSQVVYCSECVKWARKENLILDTQEEIDEWLKSDWSVDSCKKY